LYCLFARHLHLPSLEQVIGGDKIITVFNQDNKISRILLPERVETTLSLIYKQYPHRFNSVPPRRYCLLQVLAKAHQQGDVDLTSAVFGLLAITRNSARARGVTISRRPTALGELAIMPAVLGADYWRDLSGVGTPLVDNATPKRRAKGAFEYHPGRITPGCVVFCVAGASFNGT
jgi:hypothetical protein